MEKQKIIWVILAVTLLLVAVMASGLYFLKPNTEKAAVSGDKGAAVLTDTGFNSYEYMRGDSKLPGLEPSHETQPKEMTIIVGEKGGGSSLSAQKGTSPQKPSKAASSFVQTNVREKPVKSEKSVSKTKTRPRKTAKRVLTTVKEYWIQAGSYKSNTKAEELKARLVSQGVSSRILTRDIKGTTFFRVRIGPYANKPEAEKFLSWIKRIKGLKSSYISVVYVKR